MEDRPPFSFQPGGRSMHPFIRPGDRISALALTAEERAKVKPGDCVVFLDEAKRWLVHRVIGPGPEPGEFLIKGDALPRADRPAGGAAIAGRVVEVKRGESGKTYRLDRPSSRLLGRAIAALSRWEADIFSRGIPPGRTAGRKIPVRLGKILRWLLTRIFFP